VSDWAKELLKDVSRDLVDAMFHEDRMRVLERRLLPLLEAGQELRRNFTLDTNWQDENVCERWDAARVSGERERKAQ
jgi:hypothetical protein